MKCLPFPFAVRKEIWSGRLGSRSQAARPCAATFAGQASTELLELRVPDAQQAVTGKAPGIENAYLATSPAFDP